MEIFLSIDDTDNLDSPGSGELSAILAGELHERGMASHCSSISRHQLFYHEEIPYTSHNSSMCFSAMIEDAVLPELTSFTEDFLRSEAAPGSDPGLCLAVVDQGLARQELIEFGLKAKEKVLSKSAAYSLAEKTGVHLSEHGGTGDGVIGALAGIGLRLSGNDGRVRGWLHLGQEGTTLSSQNLCSHPLIDAVVDENGAPLADDQLICISDERLKTVLINHWQVIPVVRKGNGSALNGWSTLTRKEVKRY